MRRGMFKHWISISAIALTHFIVWFVLFSKSFSASMSRFDTGGPLTLSDQIVEILLSILSFPIVTIVMSIPAVRKFGGVLGWISLFANSLLWGIGLRWLIGKYLNWRKVR